jgi:hypothetical protein
MNVPPTMHGMPPMSATPAGMPQAAPQFGPAAHMRPQTPSDAPSPGKRPMSGAIPGGSGPTQHSPMPRPSQLGQNDSRIFDAEIMQIPPMALHSLRHECNLGDKDINAMTFDEKVKYRIKKDNNPH